MKTTINSTIMAVLFLFITEVLTAQVLIPAKDFAAEKKKDKTMVVIDASKAEDYAKLHVVGAINVPHKELHREGDIEGLIKSPRDLAAYFGEKGISNTSNIVIYDDGSLKYASRVYWILRYLGAENLRILHRDMVEWKAERIPITRVRTSVKATTFTPNVNASIIATADDVKACTGDCILVDSREAAEFNGTSTKRESAGHIEGARNIDFKDFLNERGEFKSADQIKAIAKRRGIEQGKRVILYCKKGVRAAVSYVALKEIAGYPDVKVYEGAYNEWKAKGFPLEK
jgi:thiosulfate/3-mercaptopyruvate sulfurtransferase